MKTFEHITNQSQLLIRENKNKKTFTHLIESFKPTTTHKKFSMSSDDQKHRLMAFNALKMLPDEMLVGYYEKVTEQSAKGKGKKSLIRGIIDSGKFQIEVAKSEEDAETRHQKIQDTARFKHVLKLLKDLPTNEHTIDDGEYNTPESLRMTYRDIFPDTPDDVIPMFAPRLTQNILDIVKFVKKSSDEGKDVSDISGECLERYKKCFRLMKKDDVQCVIATIEATADHLREITPGKTAHPDCHIGHLVDALYSYEVDTFSKDRVVGNPGNFELNVMTAGNPNSDKTIGEDPEFLKPEDECDDTPIVPGMSGHVPDIEPVQQEAVPPPNRPDPVIKVITDDEEKKNIKQNVGTLMFPSEYRQIHSGELTKQSWAKVRKTFKLTGRWEIFIKSDVGTNPKQNKYLKYRSPHFVDETFEGAYPCEGLHVSDYPYGDIYLIQ